MTSNPPHHIHVSGQSSAPAPIRRMEPMSWGAIFLSEPVEWLIDSILPKGKQVHLIGPSNTGKSLLALDWALKIVEGSLVFGRHTTRQGKVLWLDYENGVNLLKDRLESYGYQDIDLNHLDGKLHYYPFPDIASIETEEAMWDIMAEVAHYQPALIVIDSAGAAVEGDENSSEAYRGLARNLGRALRSANVTLLLLDNTGKDLSKGARGSSRKKDEADLQWLLEVGSGYGDFRLTALKDRLGGAPDMLSIIRDEDPQLHWKMAGPMVISDQAAKIVKQIQKIGGADDGALTMRKARSLGVTGGNRYVVEAVRWLKTHPTKAQT